MKIIVTEQQLKNIITEGRYSQVTREISMDLMNEVMSFLKSDDEEMEWENNYEHESFDDEQFTVQLFLNKTDSKIPYDIDGGYEFDEDDYINNIDFTIDINPKLFKGKHINKFLAELKDTIRHEIEHVSQVENPEKDIRHKAYETLAQEVLTPNELPAYIQGFYSQAKTRKMYMDDVIDEWANDRRKQFDSIEDKEYVKSELKKFGKKLLPQAKWR
jgi:predicted SprT family Zn-dependent metalloprotease